MDNTLIEWTLDDFMGELRRISLVTEPAHELDFLFFSGKKLNFKTIDEEARVVTGIAMRPNIKIPRIDEHGNLYYGFFSMETVKKAAQMYFKKGSNTNLTNLEHEYEVDGIYVFESWIVEDPENDKTKILGLSDTRRGDWVVSMKIENDAVWESYIKTGIIKGFSIEIKADELKPVGADDLAELQLSTIDSVLESGLSIDEKLDLLTKLNNSGLL